MIFSSYDSSTTEVHSRSSTGVFDTHGFHHRLHVTGGCAVLSQHGVVGLLEGLRLTSTANRLDGLTQHRLLEVVVGHAEIQDGAPGRRMLDRDCQDLTRVCSEPTSSHQVKNSAAVQFTKQRALHRLTDLLTHISERWHRVESLDELVDVLGTHAVLRREVLRDHHTQTVVLVIVNSAFMEQAHVVAHGDNLYL